MSNPPRPPTASPAAPSPSLISLDAIRVAAEYAGLSVLSDDVAMLLAHEVEYRLRELIQEAGKFMHNSRRRTLCVTDINNVMRLRNVDILYGYGSRDPLAFVKASGCKDLFLVDDREVDLEAALVSAQLPSLPFQMALGVHWLAVNGIQPEIPPNPPRAGRASATLALEARTEALILEDVEVRPAARHVLSKELQALYEKLTQVVLRREPSTYAVALTALATEPGLHQLLPYLCQFVSKQVTQNLTDVACLSSMMDVTHSLLVNPNIYVDHYLHQIIPIVLTCVVGKRLCNHPTEDHWHLRDTAARIVAHICHRWGRDYVPIFPRVIKTLLRALLDLKKPLTSHYGAIVALDLLGPQTRQLILLPNLEHYMRHLLPAIEQSKHALKRLEATACYQALLAAAGKVLQRASSDDRAEAATAAWKTALISANREYQICYQIFGEAVFPYITGRDPGDLAVHLVL